jgi:4'-phosphopantetheinyl transferase
MPEGTVHLWSARLDVSGRRLERLAGTLSPEERARADRFVLERDRRRFTAARGFVRRVLAHYLACDPEQVPLRDNGGRPEVLPARGADGLQFSVSHSADVVVVAVTFGRRIGIDVEKVRGLPDHDTIAHEIFSCREIAVWESIPPHQRQEAFFHGWTRKEAYLKAIGVGLALSPARVEVAFRPEEAPRLLHVNDDPLEAARWCVRALVPATSYVGALAVEGADRDLSILMMGEREARISERGRKRGAVPAMRQAVFYGASFPAASSSRKLSHGR